MTGSTAGVGAVRVALVYPSSGLLDGMLHAMAAARAAELFIFRIGRGAGHGAGELEGLSSLSELERAVEIASSTAAVGPDVLAYGCTAASFLGGFDHEKKLRDAVAHAAGRPATTTSKAILWSLERLGARRVAVATPYVEEVGVKFVEFLGSAGLVVVSARHAGHSSNRAKVAMTASDVCQLLPSRETLAEADAVVIPCTGMPSEALAPALEAYSGLPIITANAATLDHSLWLACSES